MGQLKLLKKKPPKVYTEVTIIPGTSKNLIIPAEKLESFLGFKPRYALVYFSESSFEIGYSFYENDKGPDSFRVLARPGYYQIHVKPVFKILGLIDKITERSCPPAKFEEEKEVGKILTLDLSYLKSQTDDDKIK